MRSKSWLFLLLGAPACVEEAPSPFVGDCAVYPKGVWEYGQIGIGTCLAGPTDLQFLDDHTVAVSNANPWADFTGGSALFLDLNKIQPGRTLVSEMDPKAIDLPSFSGAMALSDSTLLITNRLSADGRTREEPDQVWMVDVSDPAAPALSTRGEDGGATVTVSYDPVAIAVDGENGSAYVVNRTEHSVSVLDVAQTPVAVVPAGGPASVAADTFEDVDASGSTASFARLETLEAADGYPHTWSLNWRVGTVRAWEPVEGGAHRLTSNGESLWETSNVARELDVDDTSGILLAVDEPSFYLDTAAQGHMFFVDQGAIRQAVSGDFLADWNFYRDPTLEASEGWDSTVDAPSAVYSDGVWYLFYAGGDGNSSAIGLATSVDGLSFDREGDSPIFQVEGASITDPYVFWDSQLLLWRMYYTVAAGGVRFIGQAESTDLAHWTARQEAFDWEGDASRPSVGYYNGRYHLFYTAPTAEGWEVREASSVDGYDWSNVGSAFPLERESGVAMQFAPEGTFRVADEEGNVLAESAQPGGVLSDTDAGWLLQVATGYSVGPEEGGELSANGVQLDAQAGTNTYFSVTDFSGTRRIAVGVQDGTGHAYPQQAVISPKDGFTQDGVYSPVVIGEAGNYVMFFAGRSSGVTSIGRATSTDGLSWTVDAEPVIKSVGDWDSVELAPSSAVVETDGTIHLWFSAFDGQQYRIGQADSNDGRSFRRVEGSRYEWVFSGGAPGSWDDSGVRDAYVLSDGTTERMWFAGYSGALWQIGYAERAVGSTEWTVATDETGSRRPVLTPALGSFGASGLVRPVVHPTATGWSFFITGLDAGIARVGEAVGRAPDRLQRVLYQPTLADQWSFRSVPESTIDAISLDAQVSAGELLALGCSDAVVDNQRGFLYIPCRLVPEVVVVDIRDDSTPTFRDNNYLGIESIVVVETSTTAGKSGWRAAMIDEGRGWLWGLGDTPEALQAIDLSDIVDDGGFELVRRPFVAMLSLPRAGDRDRGVPTQAWVGPGQMAMHPDGHHLYVTNFNDNSVSVYDMALGPVGTLVADIPDLGENPYAIAFSPDGHRAVVSCYSGEVEGAGTHSTLVVLDTDPASPTYQQPLSWVVNQ